MPPADPRADEPAADSTAPRSRIRRLLRHAWWLHSAFALSFGIGAMVFARAGLAYADKVLIALIGSWLLMFVALRFIVGPANRRPEEGLARKGVRIATNYIIKQFYQQMFFFLVPIYASSASWSLVGFNWWLPPLLLVCAVLSTMDLVFDNVIMERRFLASLMYGLAMFGVINVVLPLVVGMSHWQALLVAAGCTPGAVALLSFSARTVMSPQGVIVTLLATGGLLAAAWYGRALIPPAPLAMPETTVGHGTLGSYECLPASKHVLPIHQLDGLRCGSLLVEPGGVKEDVVHIWRHRGHVVARLTPAKLACDGVGIVFRSELKPQQLPADPRGKWQCITETLGGQLVGLRRFEIVGDGATTSPEGASPSPSPVPSPSPSPVPSPSPSPSPVPSPSPPAGP